MEKLTAGQHTLPPLAMFAIFIFNSPVSVLSIHTNAAVEAGVSRVRSAGLMGLLSARARAHSRRFHCYRYKAHSSTIHHGRCVPHIQDVGAASRPGAL